MLFSTISAFSLAIIGASAMSVKAQAGESLGCVSKCWTNSQFVSSCNGNEKCLCDDAEFQNALYQCLYSQCPTTQFGDALHQSLGLCKSAASDESIPYLAPVRVNDLRKRQNVYGSVSANPNPTRRPTIGPIGTNSTTTASRNGTASAAPTNRPPFPSSHNTTSTASRNTTSTRSTSSNGGSAVGPTGQPGSPSPYKSSSSSNGGSAVGPTNRPGAPSPYQPSSTGGGSAVAPTGQPGSASAYQPGQTAAPVPGQPGAPYGYEPSVISNTVVTTVIDYTTYTTTLPCPITTTFSPIMASPQPGAPPAYYPSVISESVVTTVIDYVTVTTTLPCPLSTTYLPMTATPSPDNSVTAAPVSTGAAGSSPYYGATVTVTVDPDVVVITITVTSTSYAASATAVSTITVEPVPAAQPTPYSS